MTLISRRAEHLLEELHAADLAYRAAEVIEERRAQREKQERILAIKINRDKIAATLRDEEGVAWARISGAMGSKAEKKAKDAVEHGRTVLGGHLAAPAPERSDKFTWNRGTRMLDVVLEASEVASIIEFTPYTLEDVNADPNLLKMAFELDLDGQWRPQEEVVGHPVTSLFLSPVHTTLRETAEAFVA
jgi:hypothetical protein